MVKSKSPQVICSLELKFHHYQFIPLYLKLSTVVESSNIQDDSI